MKTDKWSRLNTISKVRGRQKINYREYMDYLNILYRTKKKQKNFYPWPISG